RAPQRRGRAHHPEERPRRDAAPALSRDKQGRQIAGHEGRMKILYVEDNDDNVYMLKNRLTRAGFSVVIAINGTQRGARARADRPDLIPMALPRPDTGGEEATGRLKADPATKGIPVIALPANAMAGDREKAIAAGCDDFDTKPVDMPRLLEKIAALKPHRAG